MGRAWVGGVVGGGAVGAACAWHLARSGWRVRLIERGERAGAAGGEAWRASAGMLASLIEVDQSDPLFDLRIAGREFYREQAAPLRESTGIDIGLQWTGILQAGATEAEVRTLRDRVSWQLRRGQPCEWLDADRVRKRWPWLGRTLGGQWAPRDGALDPRRLVEALRKDAARMGAELVTDTIVSLTRSNGRTIGVRGRDDHPAGRVVLAAGAWTATIGNLPRPIPVVPVRGQLIALPWPAGAPPAIVFGHEGYLLYRGGEAIAGSTMEQAGFSPEVTDAGIASIRQRAEALAPVLRSAPLLRAWAGLRPGTPDQLPIIGPEPESAGLWYATGHGRNGILLAGITGRLIEQLLSGRPAPPVLTELRPERFSAESNG